MLMVRELDLLEQFRDMSLVCEETSFGVKLGMLKLTSGILDEIREGQKSDLVLVDRLTMINQGKDGDFRIDENGIMRCHARKSKIEHQKSSGLLQPLSILEWKWNSISMDFVSGLPRTPSNCEAIWVIMDRFKKSTHFIPIRMDYPMERLAKLYIEKIVSLHGIPSSIVSERDASVHSSIGMAPFEALYSRRCRTPLCWYESGESVMVGPKIVQQTTDKIKMIREKMKVSQSHQKSYHDKRRKVLEFEISKKVGDVAYRITLLSSLANLHVVFHVSQLRRYIVDPSHVVQLDDVEVRDNFTVETLPMRIEDREVKQLRGKEIAW
ncbi:uncharacterized protein LOC127082630 [Lathyrus oleraceus]|uniref:uncharacterized protein LOC127082630 n=1 Tax=Pisum sativum TaxID=3888 RepID=UPI0021CE187C|nr:uncharacterized protein LOC127082630 [Pisum sativum]